METLTFYSRRTKQPLKQDLDSGNYHYRQYQPRGWYVRVNTPVIRPHIKVGDNFIPLENDENNPGCFVVPRDALAAYNSSLGSFAGLLQLYDGQSEDAPLSPALHIDPGSLEADEFDAIVKRLRHLALFLNSPVVYSDQINRKGQTSDVPRDETEVNVDARLIAEANVFIELCETVQRHWEMIVKAPARAPQLVTHLLDVSQSGKPLSASILQRLCQRPFARRLEVLVPQETLDTLENQFVAFVLNEIHLDAAKFVAKLTDRAIQIEQVWQDAPQIKQTWPGMRTGSNPKFGESWEKGKRVALQSVTDLQECDKRVEKAVAGVDVCRNDLLLAAIDAKLPEYPSDRLTTSDEYGPIFQAFCNYTDRKQTYFIPLKQGLENALADMSIHPAYHLYELWVLLEVYDTLVTRFGFRPETKQGLFHPMQSVDIVDGELVETHLSGTNYELIFDWPDAPAYKIKARLYYDTKIDVQECKPGKTCFTEQVCRDLHCYNKIMRSRHWKKSGLQPDLLIEFEYKRKTFKFAIDAKYRRYDAQEFRSQYQMEMEAIPVNNVYELDLLGTAKMKYLDGLGCTAAFIIHSDKKTDYTFWGGKPSDPTPHRDKSLHPTPLPEHRFGSVCATPASSYNIERLLKCFLMYHMNIDNVCWSCHKEIEAVEDQQYERDRNGRLKCDENGEPGRRTVGNLYQCDDCSQYWVSTWCKDNHHPLLKLGVHTTFHHRHPSDPEGLYCCPKCGGRYSDG